MTKLLVSFGQQNIRLGPSAWLFPTRNKLRFEWLALVALFRLSVPPDQAWVSPADIARLPSWAGKDLHHIGTNVGRYLQGLERISPNLITAKLRWTGPYRLGLPPLAVEFDLSISEVRKRLHVRPHGNSREREQLYAFTKTYVHAQWLIFQGKLVRPPKKAKVGNSAYDLLTGLSDDPKLNPTLRLTAVLGAAQVYFRLGQFKAARNILAEHRYLLQRTHDQALKAQYYLDLAWSYQRESSGSRSDRAVESALNAATAYAEDSGDRAALGLVAHRAAGYLTKHGLHLEAVNQFLLALESALITGNYDRVQASCGNIGSVLHRLGPNYYSEACRWLLLGIEISKNLRLGKEDAHGEMILGKIYAEQGKRADASRWLKRAQRIAEDARNQLNLADIKMTWGFWHQRFGTRQHERETLIEALRIFRGLKEFDCRQKEQYMARKFPEVWPEVIDALYRPRSVRGKI
jgi:tetratricopeptide (TPR) repeat protein